MKNSDKGSKVISIITPVIVSILFCVGYFMLVAIIPTFRSTFEAFGRKLPHLTMIMFIASEFARIYFYIIIPVFAVLMYFFFRFVDSRKKSSQIRLLVYSVLFCLAVIVVIVISMFLPMFQMGEVVG